MNQERCKVCRARYPKSFTKALNEVIKNCEEVVTKYEKQSANSMSKEGKEYNCECVADHVLETQSTEAVYDVLRDYIRSLDLEPNMTDALLAAIYIVLLG